MSGTHGVRVGNKGRIVLPAELRTRRNWPEGTELVAIDSDRGVILTSRGELERIVKDQLAGHDVVAELIEERRAAASAEDDE